MSSWSFAASIPVVLAALGAWTLAGWLSYANWRRGPNRRGVAWLEALRFLLITALLFTLLRPEWVRRIERKERPEVAVLMDRSASMETRDVMVSNRVSSRAEWIGLEKQKQPWRPLEKNARVALIDFAAKPPGLDKTLEGTDLNQALLSLLDQERNLKAVLLLTDGDWNMGRTPLEAATRYREQSVPIFAAAVGRETPAPDIVIESVTAPAYGLFGEQIAIPFKIQNHLAHEVRTSLTLSRQGKVETTRELTLPPQAAVQDAIVWSPTSAGEAELNLRVPVESDEALPDNNEKSFRINVRSEKLKVLVVDSLPRWEYRYLRNALERDPGVDMNCILFHPGLGAGGGRHYLSAFPETKDQISQYDVIFLGDVGIGENELSEKDAELVRGLVESQSSGLVFVPGRRGRELSLLKGPLKDLYPVVLDETKPEGIGLRNESELLLSMRGKDHWLTRFEADETRNEEIWKQLPGFFWCAAVEKSRPGAEVLAVHSALRNSWGRMPLLVTRPFGSGKVLFLGSDSAWRWRRGVEDKYHYRFWSQVVRWMAHQRHLSEKEGIRLSYSPEVPELGDTIFLQATVFDQTGFPLQEGTVVGTVTAPSGRKERLEFGGVTGGWGVFKTRFTPQESGRFMVDLASERAGRQLHTELIVPEPNREKKGEPVNGAILREIAGLSRGASDSFSNLDELIQKMALLPEPKPLEVRTRLWCDPRWGGFILFLLGFYWTGRKLAGMV